MSCTPGAPNFQKTSSTEDHRVVFYFSNFSKCPACQGIILSRSVKVLGVKHMKRYGKDSFECACCGWASEYLWNETCANYYTEPGMYGWRRPEDQYTTVRLLKRPYATARKTEQDLKIQEKVVKMVSRKSFSQTGSLLDNDNETPMCSILGKKHQLDDSVDIKAEATRLVRHSRGRKGQAITILDYQYTYKSDL